MMAGHYEMLGDDGTARVGGRPPTLEEWAARSRGDGPCPAGELEAPPDSAQGTDLLSVVVRTLHNEDDILVESAADVWAVVQQQLQDGFYSLTITAAMVAATGFTAGYVASGLLNNLRSQALFLS